MVDYLQLLRGTGQQSQTNRVQEITEITQGLKAMAKELNVPVLALSQLSRAVESREDKRPMLSDLRESGSIEQDADVVMFVYREEYYLSRAIPTQREGEAKEKFDLRYQDWFQRCQVVHNKAEVIIAKQRHGPIGNVHAAVRRQFRPVQRSRARQLSRAPLWLSRRELTASGGSATAGCCPRRRR